MIAALLQWTLVETDKLKHTAYGMLVSVLQKYEEGKGMKAMRMDEFAVSNSMGSKASPRN